MTGNSRAVSTNQTGLHQRLEEVVQRHRESAWQQPLSAHTQQAFSAFMDWYGPQQGRPLVLDSGCGTGRSSRLLAQRYPDHVVVGIDQSASRLGRDAMEGQPDNLWLGRAECADFWRLALARDLPVARHFLLYPNPWPKAAHLKRRWHGHPVFPVLMALPGALELRSNWALYVAEFAHACALYGRTGRQETLAADAPPLSDFERKYQVSGHFLQAFRLPGSEMSTG